jgi:hypothetical protein
MAQATQPPQCNPYTLAVYRRGSEAVHFSAADLDSLRKMALQNARRASMPAAVVRVPTKPVKRTLSFVTEDRKDLEEAFEGYRLRERNRRASLFKESERRRSCDVVLATTLTANQKVVFISLVIAAAFASVVGIRCMGADGILTVLATFP